ncbi:MAG: hypothetical protein K2Y31_05275 [Burkholderiales bacterium]|jgi:hypothetical protein|nr:hypothetical protein [Burkholderiales bacterium]
MLKEFAVEPALLSTWEQFRYLIEKFGVSEGRLISRYPKRWKQMVYDALGGCSEMDRKRIEVRLQNLDEKMMARSHEWDAARDWLTNAEKEHGTRPFDGIVAAQNPRAHPAVIPVAELDDGVGIWRVSREVVVPREARAIAGAMRPLLQLSRRIVFVDPHFSPYNPRARAALAACMAQICSRANQVPIESIEFHTSFRPGIARFAEECLSRLPNQVPRDRVLRIVCLSARAGGDGLHNRYVLTERGGVSLRWGLDEGAQGETDDLSLLDRDVYSTRWGQYCGPNPAFDLVTETIVIGTAR